jgi:membrane-associated phospholipid phosphatase
MKMLLAPPPACGLVLAALLLSRPAAAVGPVVHANDSDRAAGDILQFVIPAIGLGVTLYQDDTEGMKQWSYTMGSTLIATEALKRATRHTAWGERPNGGRNSFPSGHTSATCAGAGFIGQRYGWGYGAAAMAASAFVGYSRVDENLHHWRDVLAGCAIGVGFSMMFVNAKEKPAFVLAPEVGRRSAGVNFFMEF